ncbi:MAG: Flp family type IVb pilin [Sphingomonadales bacterium]|nr:Flp family type IVb pilin [Sphingomonadales bacterium]MBU3991228.1 Flp family type IVb pilin [Alphaproteobacteria bacterium]
MKTFLKTFLNDEAGASAAEYALILAIVGVGIGAAALSLGANVRQAIGDASNDVHSCNIASGTTGTWSAGSTC